jgi:hypothetical protein
MLFLSFVCTLEDGHKHTCVNPTLATLKTSKQDEAVAPLAMGCRIHVAEAEMEKLSTEKELLEKKLSRAEDAHKAEMAKLVAVSGAGSPAGMH